MGIGVSMSRLASAVANAGGIGVISGAQPGFSEPDFWTNPLEANLRAIRKEIRKARELSPNGIIGINFLVASKEYAEFVREAVKEGVDLIISGAGLPKTLPEFVKGTKTKFAPIVSSGKAAETLLKLWDRRYQVVPDAIIVEGPLAGGHLGFSREDLESKAKDLYVILEEVLTAVKEFVERYQKPIPVIAAGGIFTGAEMKHALSLGAAGVQISTRFVATEECDADDAFKQMYIDATEEDVVIIQSPVGLPGRAIQNDMTRSLKEGRIPVKACTRCIGHCDPATTPFCITKALIQAVTGDVHNGLVFAGHNAYLVDKISTVQDVIDAIVEEYNAS
jgi:NAD(P)H-dependent flavin oxidoreductase YrpB (nitropropane dioxygenase family)